MLSTDRQTDRQSNQRYQKHNLLCQGGNTLIVVAYPDHGAGNDFFFFFFFFFFGWVVFHHQGSRFLQWAIWE